ncbi:hypothetical protein GCM10022227_16620 [Streptomyces sedi]
MQPAVPASSTVAQSARVAARSGDEVGITGIVAAVPVRAGEGRYAVAGHCPPPPGGGDGVVDSGAWSVSGAARRA